MPLLDQSAADDWTSGLFACSQDPAGTCDNICCYCSQYGRQCGALEGMANTMEPKWCVVAFFCGCLAPCLVCQMRGKVRDRFGISGGALGDALASFCCTACAHCHNGRELTNRGYWPGGSICASHPPGGVG